MRFQCTNCKGIVAIDDSECGQPVGCGHCGNVTVVPQDRFSPTAVINDFVIRQTLGSGGMGMVYLAHQLSLDRPVALKILMEQYSRDRDFIIDFVKEARAAARLNHPNIVQSYAVGQESEVYFFAMEYVEGETLKQLLDRSGRLPIKQALQITRQIAEALDFAWKNQQLVHRDIKPDNIMLTSNGVAKLADLGLARFAAELGHDENDQVMGTPQYISPEQLTGGQMDVRADVYSLGATLYQTVTGHFPFGGSSPAEIARKHLTEPLRSPAEVCPDIPDTTCWLIKKMMAKDREQRYTGADALYDDLQRILDGREPDGYIPGMDPATGVVAAVPPPAAAAAGASPAAAAPAATSGKSGSKKFKTGKKKKLRMGGGTTTVGGSSSDEGSAAVSPKDAAQAGAEAAAPSRRAPAPAGSNTNKVIIAVLAMLLVGAGLVVGLWLAKQRYRPGSTAAVEALYLEGNYCTPAERQAYEEIRLFFDQDLQNNRAQLTKVVGESRQFLRDYPESLFTTRPSADQLAAMVGIPGFLISGVEQYARPLAGTVATQLVAFEEQLLRANRQLKYDEEQETIKQRRRQEDLRQRLAAAEEDLHQYLEGVQGELRAFVGRYKAHVESLQSELEGSKPTVREKMLALGTQLAFGELAGYIEATIRGVPIASDLRYDLKRYVARDELREAGSKLRQLAADNKLSIDDLRERLGGLIKNSELPYLVQQLQELAAQEDEIPEAYKAWLNQHLEVANLGRKYHALVANTGRALAGQKVLLPREMKDPNQKTVVVSLINRSDIVLKVEIWDPKLGASKFENVQLPLHLLDYKEFIKLADYAWGEQDRDELLSIRGAFLFYSAHFAGAREAWNEVGGGMADFIQGEMSASKSIWLKLYIESWYQKIVAMIAAKELALANAAYSKLKKQFGETPEFQAREEDFTQAFP